MIKIPEPQEDQESFDNRVFEMIYLSETIKFAKDFKLPETLSLRKKGELSNR